MKRISAERKEAVIKKMLPPLSMSVNELMEIEGISRTTL
jgi:DNA-binding Xre family transcriptional regulator